MDITLIAQFISIPEMKNRKNFDEVYVATAYNKSGQKTMQLAGKG